MVLAPLATLEKERDRRSAMKGKAGLDIRAWLRRISVGLTVLVMVAVVGPQGALAEPLSSPSGAPTEQRAGKWIEIDLSSQTLIAWSGRTRMYTTRVSTGTNKYPTVQGTFRVYTKLRSQRMRGGTGRDRYDLPNVPHVMYFYRDYAIHGAYWHNNFGRPMSHGCVNLPLRAAQWMYNWAPIGTQVVVHR
jgi:lipoprotein-anchoring transpeptidase ErfK/SrfK